MKKNKRKVFIQTIKEHIINNKKEYIIVSIIFVIGIFLGVFFINNVNQEPKSQITEYLNQFIEPYPVKTAVKFFPASLKRGGRVKHGVYAAADALGNFVRVVPPVPAPHPHDVPALLFEKTAGVHVPFERRFIRRIHHFIHLYPENIVSAPFIVHRHRYLIAPAAQVGIRVIAQRPQFCGYLLLHRHGELGMLYSRSGRRAQRI